MALGGVRPSMAQQSTTTYASVGHTSLAVASTTVLQIDDRRQPSWFIADQSSADQARVLTDFLSQLPLERIHQVLKTNHALRMTEGVLGAALVGYACARPEWGSRAAYAGLQALRLSGGDILEPHGFRIEPAIGSGGFAISIRKRLP